MNWFKAVKARLAKYQLNASARQFGRVLQVRPFRFLPGGAVAFKGADLSRLMRLNPDEAVRVIVRAWLQANGEKPRWWGQA